MYSSFLLIEIQSIFAFLDNELRWLSMHAYSKHYLLITAILYWTGYMTLAARLASATLLSTLIFGGCRHFFPSPRPYWQDPSLFRGVSETGFGMPSGHTQNATTFWGILAWSLKSPLITALVTLPILIIGLSRLYLGVHYPIQVLTGLSIGLLLVFIWGILEQKTLHLFRSFSLTVKLLLVTSVAATPLIITLLLRELADLGPGGNSAMPYGFMCLNTGMLSGTLIFLTLNTSGKPVNTPTLIYFLTRAVPGALILITLWQWTAGAKLITENSPITYYCYSFLRGFFCAAWVLAIWPWLYKKSSQLMPI